MPKAATGHQNAVMGKGSRHMQQQALCVLQLGAVHTTTEAGAPVQKDLPSA